MTTKRELLLEALTSLRTIIEEVKKLPDEEPVIRGISHLPEPIEVKPLSRVKATDYIQSKGYNISDSYLAGIPKTELPFTTLNGQGGATLYWEKDINKWMDTTSFKDRMWRLFHVPVTPPIILKQDFIQDSVSVH